jgi:hypothetical protein
LKIVLERATKMNMLPNLTAAVGSVGSLAAEAQVIETLKDILCGIGVVYFILHVGSFIVGFVKALGSAEPDEKTAVPERLMKWIQSRIRSAPMSR